MSRQAICAFLLVLLAVLTPPLAAESHEEAAPAALNLFYVWTDHVATANAHDYEREVGAVLARLKATEEGKKLQFMAFWGPEVGYAYAIPLADMADFVRANQDFMAATAAIGGMEAWDASNQFVEHGSGQLFLLRPDLSYTPANPRPAEASGLFRWYNSWYARPEKEEEIEAVAKKFQALYKEKNIDTGWRVYKALTGPDLPLYLVVVTAADAADYHANDARVNGLLGQPAQDLFAEANGYTRHLEQSWSMIRPDLSMGMDGGESE